MHDCTAVMGSSNENGLRHFHILCPIELRSWAVYMKTAPLFSFWYACVMQGIIGVFLETFQDDVPGRLLPQDRAPQ
jgi:hypothetical protein